jgi:histidinol-phosphate aminotransferase
VFALRDAATWCLARAGDVVEERAKLATALGAYGETFASEANLVLVRFSRATEIWRGLADRGIVVRNFDGPPGPLAGCLRITVGTAEENAMLLAALAELCG